MAFNFRAGAPASSKSPMTPSRKGGKSSFFSQAPSTTPAGEPPSYMTNRSTTPAQPPPRGSKIFGSSYNAANNTFGHRLTPGRRGRGFAVPESSPPPGEEDDDDDEDADGEAMDEGYGTQTGTNAQHAAFASSIGDKDSPRGLKRSRNGQAREQIESGMAQIARQIARDSASAQIIDTDDIVLQTEAILSTLDTAIRLEAAGDRDEYITLAATKLTKAWSQSTMPKTKEGSVGPETSDPFAKAQYLSELLLQLHHPHSSKPTFAPTQSRSQRTLLLPKQNQSPSISVPRAMLDWLDAYHKPLADDFDDIHRFRPSPAASESFWDVVGAELCRGHFGRVIRLLKDAGFGHAITALDDGRERLGYSGKQLENVEEVVARYVRVLEICPAVQYEDWDVKGAEWAIFRQVVRNGINDLESFAKGNIKDEDEFLDQSLQADTNIFARSQSTGFGSMAAASMRAGSRVPWAIYENLKTMYGALLGGGELLDFAQDWVEGSIFATVWWDGDDGEALNASLAGRNSLRRSRGTGGGTREVDVSPLTAYRRRLGEMLRTVVEQVEEPNFQPDSMDPVQVGLVCVMEDSIEAAVGLLQTWDPTVATAVVEIAAMGGWLPLARPSSRGLLQRGFSNEDLMVLSHGPGQQKSITAESVDRDQVLTEYADLLASKNVFLGGDGKLEREGWELAVSVLSRLDDFQVSQGKISKVLEDMQFQDAARVDKVLVLCANMGLVEQARDIAERYADTLAENHDSSYGSALVYFARAHANQKLKSTISLMISLCLLQSAAIPAQQNLDLPLASLLSTERAALVELGSVDADAANLLSVQLSGYALVRKFYDLRDGKIGNLKPLARKREAAKALIAVIESASDCIRGGLFDPEVQSVVPVDGLLVLLGEALPLLGNAKRILSEQQVFALMRVVEDFDTAPGRIREEAGELLQGSINAYRGASALTLKKTRSNVSFGSGSLSGSSWDMLASETMLPSQEKGRTEVARGWDWRKGLDAVAGAQVDSKEVLALLRTALAQEVAKSWGGIFLNR